MYQHTTLRNDAQQWLFELEANAGRQAMRIVDGIIVSIYNLADEVIYWFADMATGDEFVTTDFVDAVDVLAYAVS